MANTPVSQKKADRARRTAAAPEMCYVRSIPRKPLPNGIVLVHNHVVPQKKLGWNGFRAWTQQRTDELISCKCDWAGVDLRKLQHYRVRREVEG
jgi:hypothetical protein